MRAETLCRSCRSRIIWVRSASTDKLLPLDAVPNPTGRVVLDAEGDAVVPEIAELWQSFADETHYTTSHFVTCPDATAGRT